jgi:tRNA1(Val) A37 N6-methylase TrmN6
MTGFQEIYVLNKRLKLTHTAEGFKTSMDSVLLAAACPAQAGDHVLDMGCGVGGAGLCVLKRVQGVSLTGVEIQQEHASLAQQNAQDNELGEVCEFITSDIRDFRREKAFDHVICNPPYLETGAHLRSPSPEKATAMGHGEVDLSIQDWVDTAFHCLKPRGTLTMIHRTDFTDKIIQALGTRFGAVEIFPLWPKEGKPSKRMVIRAGCERKSPMTLHYGMVLHNEEREYTDAVNKVLRDAQVLF